MDQYKLIRHLYAVEGLSQRQIAKRLGISRNTVRRYCQGQNVPWERKSPSNPINRVLTPEIRAFVQSCLDEDQKNNCHKQKHTAKRIYDRLREEFHFQGGESTVRRLVRELKAKIPGQAFIPLEFAPGEAARVDWGTAKVIMQGRKQEVNLFCIRLCHSCAPFVIAYPSQREEAFLEGHQEAFKFFGGVPQVLIYDNLKTAVKEGWGKIAREQEKFAAFRAHYAYQSRFCNPGEGHEKGLVENLVGYIRRNVLVPIPVVDGFEELNQLLAKRCRQYIANHQIREREMSVKESFALEQQALTTLPVKTYEACKISEVKVGYYATVSFENNHYSVPVKWVGYTVTVKASAFTVKVYCRGQEIAVHPRSYEKHKTIYTLEHYLPLLESRPRSVFNARPVRQANLPQVFYEYASRLKDPEKGMVRLLRLLVDHGLDRLLPAIEKACGEAQYSVDVVQCYLGQSEAPKTLVVSGPTVKPVDLRLYDVLVAGGGCV